MRSRTFLIGCVILGCLCIRTVALVASGQENVQLKSRGLRLRAGANLHSPFASPVNRLRGGFLMSKGGGGGFEFTQEQEAVFADTANLMGRAANFYLLEALALLVCFVVTIVDTKEFNAKAAVLLFWGIHHGWCGIHAARGAECFNAIKRTQGNDIDYLMDAVLIQKEYWRQLLAPAYLRIACIVVLVGFSFVT